jgi:hypothetical protein
MIGTVGDETAMVFVAIAVTATVIVIIAVIAEFVVGWQIGCAA